MLARALAQDTPILMLDEPTAHLDLPSRILLMRLLHQLARETRKAILLSTHELDLALQVADEVWLLQAGGELLSGAPEDLVLNGSFESAFSEEKVVFDKRSGNFVIYIPQEKPIRLTGEGIPLFWTRRALRRAGFEPVASAGLHVRIEEREGRPVWLLEQESMTTAFDNIQKLLQAIV
jgi:iron complex transport system ATP-binding protein